MVLFPSTQNIAILFQTLLFYATLALSLPTNRDGSATQQIHSKRATPSVSISSSAVGGIAGGAVGLILLSLFIGLGAASIAVIGSLEWREWRGKKEEGKGQNGKGVESDSDSESGSIRQQRQAKDESTTNEKARTGKLSSARLTLKSFMPLDFRSGWLPNSNK